MQILCANFTKRLTEDFVPRTEKVTKGAFKENGKAYKDAWYLGIVSTDPDFEGRGTYRAYVSRTACSDMTPKVIPR